MQGVMSNGDPWPQEVHDAYNAADVAIRDLFNKIWKANGDDKPGDMITDWVLGVHYIDLEIEASQGYAFESTARSPHTILGLFDLCAQQAQKAWDQTDEEEE
jgi:hypothetical protein